MSDAPRGGILYPPLLGVARFLARRVFGFRLEAERFDRLPRDADGRPLGGWIAAGLPHRRWIDPFLLVLLLPAAPRVVFFGDARTMRRSPFRRLLFRLIGGVVPIPPGGGVRSFAAHVAAARRVLEAGNVFAIFPEAGPPSPPGRARRVEPGIGYLAIRTGMPVVPLAIGGNEELYRGRRLIVRALPPLQPPSGLAEGGPQEREAAHRFAAEVQERSAEAVATLHARVELTSSDEPRRWRWLSDWLY
jgi:1-acyl-sn-glycerol-3-phosphate acyltransferase